MKKVCDNFSSFDWIVVTLPFIGELENDNLNEHSFKGKCLGHRLHLYCSGCRSTGSIGWWIIKRGRGYREWKKSFKWGQIFGFMIWGKRGKVIWFFRERYWCKDYPAIQFNIVNKRTNKQNDRKRHLKDHVLKWPALKIIIKNRPFIQFFLTPFYEWVPLRIYLVPLCIGRRYGKSQATFDIISISRSYPKQHYPPAVNFP